MQDAKEEVRARLVIEDVVGEYVNLKRAGRNFRGLSPFSGEKTPSFYVSPDKNIWHDFSSNKGGDVFSFVMEVEGIGFREALELLARKAGIDLSVYESKGNQAVAKLRKRLVEAHRLAAQYYQQSLVKNQHAVEYVFKKRGLSKEIVTEFQIGYAPDSGNALTQFLAKKGFSANELAEAGLTNRFGGDLFRSRMMVPLMDTSGQVIGFTARIIGDDPNAPKYLNTPQTLLYDKSRHVFGLSQAKDAIRTNNYAVLVEGNLDVISSHQAGIKQVVATAGTALTEYHLKAFSRLTSNIRLSFDGDKAGVAATERAIPIAQIQEPPVELSVISMPEGAKDPDELIKQDPALWQKAIDNSVPAVEWVIDQYARRYNLNTEQGKSDFVATATDVVRNIDSAVLRGRYIEKIAIVAGTREHYVNEVLNTNLATRERLKKVANSARVGKKLIDPTEYQDNLIALTVAYPETRNLLEDLPSELLATKERQEFLQYLKDHPTDSLETTPKELQEYDTYVKIVLLKADARYGDWSENDRSIETARLIRQVITEHKKKQKDMLTHQLREAEENGHSDRAAEIRGTLNGLIKEISDGKK